MVASYVDRYQIVFRIVAVIADGQRIDCEVVFMSNEYVPDVYVDRSKTEEWTTRATFVTDNSLWKEEGEHVRTPYDYLPRTFEALVIHI